ncbi:ATP-binding protein [Traorella massiliensis]|uniref:hypothetical protein n=1 Tax=Traorella massiliensis TaxID=1903263 RepID=UPI0008F969A8|nr:hypothetical protein [Traorella massiliensis]
MIINMLIGNLLLLINLTIFSMKVLSIKNINKYLLPVFIFIGIIILSSRSYPSLKLMGTFSMITYYIIFVFLIFTGSPLKKILTLVLFLSIATLSEVLSANIMNLVFGLNENSINTHLYTIALLLSSIVTYTLLNLLSKFINIYIKYQLPKKIWLIFILPLTTILLLINLNEYFSTFRTNALLVPIILGLLIANLITIYVFFQSIKSIQLESEVREIQSKYDTINTLYQNNFDFLHNTIWKLNQIYKKAENINDLELSKEIDELSNDLLKKYNIINTNSSIISSILNYRLNEIIENNILVKCDITYNNFSFLNKKNEIELFATLINNAIDSCLATKKIKKMVLISSNKINQQILIKCIYSYSDSYKDINFNQLSIVGQILETNNGIMNTFKDSDNYLKVIISFNKPNITMK